MEKATRRNVLPRSLEFNTENISLVEMVRRKLKRLENEIKQEKWLESRYKETKGRSLYSKGTRRTSLPDSYSADEINKILDCNN